MNIQNDQLKSALESAVTKAHAVAGAALSSAERIAQLNVETARKSLSTASANVQALMNAKNMDEMRDVHMSLVQPTASDFAEYARSLRAISSEAHQELAQFAEAHFAEFQNHVQVWLDRAAQFAPAGSESTVESIRKALQNSTAAYEYLTKATQEVAEVAQESIESVTQPVKPKAKSKSEVQ